jgi:hypothetical protein
MTEEAHSGAGDGDLFEVIDHKLNVFALANGMDLSKGDAYRRLEWFTEGLERGILIEAGEPGTFRIRVLSWKTGAAEDRAEALVGENLTAEEVGTALTDSIASANDL